MNKWTVQILKTNGEVETLARGLDAERADAMVLHPSLGGCHAIRVPDSHALPAG